MLDAVPGAFALRREARSSIGGPSTRRTR